MQEDLRAFLGKLEANDKLLRVKKECNPKFEVPAVMKKAERLGKAVIFESVSGSNHRIVNNVFGSRSLLSLAFNCHPQDVVREFTRRSQNRVRPKVVSDAPVKEVILKGSDVDLRRFPIVTHCEKDAGPYITAGVVIAKDPDTGRRNVSLNRMLFKDKETLGIRMMPPQHLGIIHSKYEQRGKPCEVAVAIGNHPFEMLAAATTLLFGDDEFELAGGLREEPLEVIHGETVDLEVPANAEIIIEGEVLSGVREPEGPFGDFMQYYVPVMDNHVLKVKAITMRKDAIYQTIQASSLEDIHLLALSRESKVYQAAIDTGAQVVAVNMVPTILGCVISIKKQFEGEPKNVAAAAFGRYSWLKFCVIVDHDVDVFDINDVWWAMVTRGNYSKGLFVLDNALGFPRDPFEIHKGKLAIDATAPLNQWDEFERKRIPGEDTVRLEDYI